MREERRHEELCRMKEHQGEHGELRDVHDVT